MKKIIITGISLIALSSYANTLNNSDGYSYVKIISGSKSVSALNTDRTQYDFTCDEFHGDFQKGKLLPNSSEVCSPSKVGDYSAILPITNEDGVMCSITLSPADHKIIFGSKGCPMASAYNGSVYSEGDDSNKGLVIDFSNVDRK